MTKPVLQAMVLADHVYRDADTNKFLIIGTFGKIAVRPESTTSPSNRPSEIEGETMTVDGSKVSSAGTPYLYVALTGVRGKMPLRLRYISLSDSTVSLEADFDIEAKTPLVLAEFCIPLPSLTREPGLYSLDLMHDGEILGSWRVTVFVLETGKN